MTGNESPDWVTVATFGREEHAHMARGMLESHDIEARVLFSHTRNLARGLFLGSRLATPPCQLQVARWDVEATTQLLRETEARHIEAEGVTTEEEISRTLVKAVCPKCGHDTAIAETYTQRPWLTAVMVVGLLMLLTLNFVHDITWQVINLSALLGAGVAWASRQETESVHYSCVSCGAQVPPEDIVP